MNIKLAYGTELVPIDVPDNWINGRCYRPHPMTGCADARAELMAMLSGMPVEQQLEQVAQGKSNCAIAVDSDNPALFTELLPALIEIIEDASSIHAKDITLVLSNRMSNPLRGSELGALLHSDLISRHRVELHDPGNPDAWITVGESSRKVPITVNRTYHNAELKIILGGVRPDLILGFTGGRAVIMPGLAGKPTLKAMFSPKFVGDRNARFGNFRDNPFHMTGVESVNAVGCDLAISAMMTPNGEICRVFAGHFGASHLQAMTGLRDAMSVRVKEPMDIVVTSAGGSPSDNTLASVVTTICSVQPVLKPGGTIVIAAALEHGLGPEPFARLVANHQSIPAILERLAGANSLMPAEYLAQKFYSVLKEHEVILFNKTMPEADIWKTGLTPSRDMNEAVLGAMESHGQRCKIVALPEGPHGIGEVQVTKA